MENNNNFELKEAFDLFDADGDGQVCLYTDTTVNLLSARKQEIILLFSVFSYSQDYLYLGNNSRARINV